jgi:crotonobetainyl-CoA:carnitine CoA-transferase CaiB-like acyl-CoA transferase
MSLTGEPDGPPSRTGYSVVDNTGGMMAAVGLLAKLVTGRGGQIDISLFDVILSQLNYLASVALNGGPESGRLPNGAHPFFVPAQIFPTSDHFVALFITHNGFWNIFAAALGRQDWIDDPRFSTMSLRSENRDLLISQVSAELAQRTADQLVDHLRPQGIVIARVNTIAEALQDPHLIARNMIAEICTTAQPMRLIGNPIKIDGVVDCYEPSPKLGQHNEFYAAEFVGNDRRR